MRNRLRRKSDKQLRRDYLRRALRTESLEQRQFLAADSVPSLVNFATTEHTDLNISSQWALGPLVETDPPTQFANDEVVLYVGEPAETSRSAEEKFDFIGPETVEEYYLLPQSQNVEVLYAGFASYGLGSSVDRYDPATESKGRVSGVARYAKATLTDVRHTTPDGEAGDGDFSLWQSGSQGNPIVAMASWDDGVENPNADGLDVTDGISADDAMWIYAGGHAHYNFGFTQPGRYEIDLKLSAYFGDDNLSTPNESGYSESASTTLYFSVMSVGELQFDQSSYTVNESEGNASIDVVRVGGSDGRITATYATSDNTALEPSDYTATNGTLEFLDGETVKTITVPIIDDTDQEGDESFTVELSTAGPSTLDGYLKAIEEDDNGLLGSLTTTTVTIPANDTPPTISDIADQSIDENASTGALAFTVDDAETAPADLIVSATSSNPALLPNDNIVLGGSGANRTVTITPVADLYGVATITLTVEDEDGLTATDTFVLTVNAANEPPTISDVANQSIEQDTATGPISFTVGDVETSAAALTVSATSSNLTLVPNSSIVLGGSGANRTVSVTPAAGQMGNATITLTVTDGNGGTATDTFVLNVGPSNAPPTISDISDQTTDAGAMTGEISFTVGDTTTAAGALVVTAASSNVAVIPDANITLGGSGADRTISITPVPGRIGSTTITVTVTDEGGLQASDTFELVVTGTSLVPFGVPEVVGSGLDYVFEPELADINGDGHVDILTASYAADKVVWFENLGDGTYGPEQIVAAEAGYPWEAHVADLDADGDQDVIVGGYFGDLVWQENLGDSFGPAQSIDTELYGPFIRSADVDGDGKLDVLVARDFGGDIYWYRNEGDGVFGSANVIATGLSEATGFVVRDLNGDGRPEAITGEYGANQLAYFVNNGDGTFGTKQTVASTSGSSVFAADDLNGDGIDDLLVVGLDSLDIGFHAGQSDGTIGPFTALPSVSKPAAASTADFDQDGDFDVLIGSYGGAVYWLQNFGGGSFSDSIEITRDVGQVNGIATADIDSDGDPDVVAADLIRGEIVVLPNRLGEFATTIRPPAARIYPAGQSVDLSVHFGYPVEVTGTPSVSLQVGSETVEATYVSGSGTTELLFRYMVVETDADDDGIELVSTSIDLKGGSLIDPAGDPVDLTLPAVDLSGVLVNGSAPVVHSVERSSDNPTAAHDVTFQVTFSESVTGVDVGDFGVTLNGVADASVTDVSGSGDEYFVTVSTGTGSGTIGLEVLETATITDTEANVIGEGFVGGEVFTLNRRPARQITNFFTQGHGDIGVGYSDGQWDMHAYVDDLYTEFAPDEVLIVGGPDSKVTAPSDTAYDFLGAEAGSEIYVLPQSNVPATIPDLGIGAGGINSDAMASYFNDDPRVDSTGSWVELQVVDVRLPEGGQFSLYSSGVEEPNVWVASSDGIDDQDAVFAFANSHGHYNWAFTKPGIYEIDLFASGFADQNGNGTYDEGDDRYTESGIVTYYFSIDPPEGPQPYTIAADPPPAPALVPFSLPEYYGGSAFSFGAYDAVNADFNGDGHADLVMWGQGNPIGTALVYSEGTGDGGFLPVQSLHEVSGYGHSFNNMTPVDYDNDGDVDMLAFETGGGEAAITLYSNDGTGQFTRSVLSNTPPGTKSIQVGDFNGDGRADTTYLTTTDDNDPEILTTVYYALQQPDGQLGPAATLWTSAAGDDTTGNHLVGDVTGDGNLDVVISETALASPDFEAATHPIRVYPGTGDGTFGAEQASASEGGETSLQQIADVNGDGRFDVIVTDSADGSIAGYYPQQADGTLGGRVGLPLDFAQLNALRVADINGDDLPDVVTSTFSSSFRPSVSWHAGL
ncbi:MAG: FG-GAP-like repeat-containing protein, partial [Rhodopirellula sp. JB053]